MIPCPFCAVVAGACETAMLLEAEDFLCFTPLTPEVPGHTLIVSRVHYTSLLDASTTVVASLPEVCQSLLRHFRVAQGATAFNLLSANGIAAQQSVMHLHLHFLPRREGDGIDAWPSFARGT